MRISRKLALGIAILCLNFITPLHAGSFCIRPILDEETGKPVRAYLNSDWAHDDAGSDNLIFLTRFTGAWTLNTRMERVKSTQGIPTSFFDRWVTIPWSGRILGIKSNLGLFIRDPGDVNFRRLNSNNGFNGEKAHAIFILYKKQKVIVRVGKDLYELKGENLWPAALGTNSLAINRPSTIRYLAESRFFDGLVASDTDGGLYFLDSDNKWHPILNSSNKTASRVLDSPPADAVITMGSGSVGVIQNLYNFAYKFDLIAEHSETRGRVSDAYFSTTTNKLLFFDRARFFRSAKGWMHLTKNGLEKIPGAPPALPLPKYFSASAFVSDVELFSKALISTTQGLYLYDGNRMDLVGDGTENDLGTANPVEFEAAGIVAWIGKNSFTYLRPNSKILKMHWPFVEKGLPRPIMKAWPEANSLIVLSGTKIFIIDDKLQWEQIPTEAHLNLQFGDRFFGVNPKGKEMIFSDGGLLYAAISKNLSDPSLCP